MMDNQRLPGGVGAQHDRVRVLSFLTEDGVEPTSNRAERDPRPAVIARSRITVKPSRTGLNSPLINYRGFSCQVKPH